MRASRRWFRLQHASINIHRTISSSSTCFFPACLHCLMSIKGPQHLGAITLYTYAQAKRRHLSIRDSSNISSKPRTHPTSLSGFSMCQVQRVTNTCGHRNDHVLMSCRTAKSFLESSPECPNYSHRRSLLAVPIKRRLLDAANAGSITIHGGFHACTEPYCRMAIVRELRSAEGFVCMVPGCGRVG